MTADLVSAAAYHRIMSEDGLPRPSTGMRLPELRDRESDALEMASIAAMIDAGNLPPISELIARDDRGELP